MIKKTVFLSMFLFIGGLSFAQNVKFADVLGKWYVISMAQDSMTLIDVENPENAFPYYQKTIGKEGMELTSEDSLTILLVSQMTSVNIQESYFEFKKNKSYTTSLNSGAEIEKGSGKWSFNEATQQISFVAKGKKSTETSDLSIVNGVLRISTKNIVIRFRKRSE